MACVTAANRARPGTSSSCANSGSWFGCSCPSSIGVNHGMSVATPPAAFGLSPSTRGNSEKKSLSGHGCVSTQVRSRASEPWTSCR
eukprot:8671724-Pyramimonas_sp.AAC.1